MAPNPNLRAPEAAKYLRMSTSTLAKFRCYGGGPAYSKAGSRLVLYSLDDLVAWLKHRQCASTSCHTAMELNK